MARALFCTFSKKACAERVAEKLVSSGIANENISWLAMQRVDGESNSGRENKEEFPLVNRPFHSKGHFKWAIEGAKNIARTSAVSRALQAMGIPAAEAREYELLTLKGEILFSVYCQDILHFKIAKVLLRRNGARELASIGDRRREYDLSKSTLDL